MASLSNCERQFVSNCIIENQTRRDGRQLIQGRNLDIVFGKERGSCMVLLGNTRVLAQVSSEVTEPRFSDSYEGTFFVNFDFSPMASPEAQTYSRYSSEFIEYQRCLERCLRESRCVDLESLCIRVGAAIWTIRVDIRALNDDGNLLECASIAGIAALAHFRRPAITLEGIDFIVHPVNERNPVPLSLHHMPLTICVALFSKSKMKYIVVDPNEMEEKVCEGCYFMGVNAHQEICFVHRRGAFLLQEDTLRKIEEVAIQRAQEVTQIIRSALDEDTYKRETNAPIGFANLIRNGTILGAKQFKISEINLGPQDMMDDGDDKYMERVEHEIIDTVANALNSIQKESEIPEKKSHAKESALHILEQESGASGFEGRHSQWGGDSNDESSVEIEVSEVRPTTSAATETLSLDSDEEIAEVTPSRSSAKKTLSSDSDEEIVYIGTEQLDKKSSEKRGWFSKDPFA